MSSQRGASTTAKNDSRGAREDRSAQVRAGWPPPGDRRPPVGHVTLDADQARMMIALVLVALALIYAAQAVGRMGLRPPRIVPLSAAGRAEASRCWLA